MKKHQINTPVKPRTKLPQLLVHPKDKIDQYNKCNVIFMKYHVNYAKKPTSGRREGVLPHENKNITRNVKRRQLRDKQE